MRLSRAGRSEIAALAAEWVPESPVRIVSSDLARARESADVLAHSWAWMGEREADARLREMHFGCWDGRLWSEIERVDAVRLKAWMNGWQEGRAPEGESFADVIDRAGTWLTDALARTREGHFASLVAVAHAGSIRALLIHLLGLTREQSFEVSLDYARVSAVQVPAGHLHGGAPKLLYLNARPGSAPIEP